jgi:hypothetical protein
MLQYQYRSNDSDHKTRKMCIQLLSCPTCLSIDYFPLACSRSSSDSHLDISVYLSSLCSSCADEEEKVDMSQLRLNSQWRRQLKSFRGRAKKTGHWTEGDADSDGVRVWIFREGISRSESPRYRGCWPRNDHSWMQLAPIEEEVASPTGKLCHKDSWPKNDWSWVILNPIVEEVKKEG